MSRFNQLDRALDDHDFAEVRRLISEGMRPTVRPYGNCFHIILSQVWCPEWKAEMIELFASIGEDINYTPGLQNGVYTGSPLYMATRYNVIRPLVLKKMFENGAKDDRARFSDPYRDAENTWMPE